VKIVLVSPYALTVFGGVQEQVLGMSRSLSERGHDVHVVCPGDTAGIAFDTPAAVHGFGRVTSVPANGSRAPLSLGVAASRQLRHWVSTQQPDVVHLHEPFAPTLGWATLRSHEAPTVATFHRSGLGPDTRIAGPLLRRLAKGIDSAASVSASAAQTAHAGYGVSSRQLFNGFEVERFQAFERTVPANVTLFTVGRLEERKGVGVAIRAVLRHNAACASAERWRLEIAGDGPDRERLQQLAGDSEDIAFLGSISDVEKRRRLRQSSVALCPALFGESFGLVLLEAMAAQVPVVASDIDGYRAAASSFASMFAPDDDLDMVRAIERALTQDAHVTAQALAHARSWSMQALVVRYEALYEEAQRRFMSR
jgi:phosphatidylinositol alpha-mannosyltransferase